MGKKLTKEQRQNIVNLYLSGRSGIWISENFQHSTATIAKVLREEGIEVQKGRDNRWYSLNEHYLDELNNANKFYFLGYFYADGYIPEKKKAISVDSIDKEILEKFKKLFDSDRPLQPIHPKNPNSKEVWSFRINSILIHKRIHELGCDNEKTTTAKFPINLFYEENSKQFLRDFIRGYFDGDGSLYLIYSNVDNCRGGISIVGSFDFIKKLQEILKEELGINSYFKKGKGAYYIEFKKVQAVYDFLNWIYYDNVETYLQRKFNLAKEYFEIRKQLEIEREERKRIGREKFKETIKKKKLQQGA